MSDTCRNRSTLVRGDAAVETGRVEDSVAPIRFKPTRHSPVVSATQPATGRVTSLGGRQQAAFPRGPQAYTREEARQREEKAAQEARAFQGAQGQVSTQAFRTAGDAEGIEHAPTGVEAARSMHDFESLKAEREPRTRSYAESMSDMGTMRAELDEKDKRIRQLEMESNSLSTALHGGDRVAPLAEKSSYKQPAGVGCRGGVGKRMASRLVVDDEEDSDMNAILGIREVRAKQDANPAPVPEDWSAKQPSPGSRRQTLERSLTEIDDVDDGDVITGLIDFDRARLMHCHIDPLDIVTGKELGRGAGGVVRLGRYRGLPVAVKTLHPVGLCEIDGNVLHHSVARKDLVNEIQLLSTLRHPNLVLFMGGNVHESRRGGHKGEPIMREIMLVSEFLEGGNFEEYVKRTWDAKKAWDPSREKILKWGVQLARGLAFLHQCTSGAVVHRDLKPSNLMLDSSETIKLCDFGLGKMLDKMTDGPYEMTGHTGSLRYMAPEVYHNQHYDETVDIYSCGMVMHFMVTGQPPFSPLQAQAAAQRASQGHRPSTHVIKKKSAVLAALVSRCWKQEPQMRLSALDLVEHLEFCLLSQRLKHGARNSHASSSTSRTASPSPSCPAADVADPFQRTPSWEDLSSPPPYDHTSFEALLHQSVIGPCKEEAPTLLRLNARRRHDAWLGLAQMTKSTCAKKSAGVAASD